MLCFKDQAFCAAKCLTMPCDRQFTPELQEQARAWWARGNPAGLAQDGPPIAWEDFSLNGRCPDYQPLEGA